MLPKRRNEIIEKIRTHRMVKVSDLVNEYQVSIETIRRDLEYLESLGHLKRVYGGAVINGLYGQEPVFSQREVVNHEEKRAIGIKAAELINDGDTLFIEVGTTLLEVARNLLDKKGLTVITNTTLISNEMVKSNDCRVILLGGELRQGELSVSGHLCDENLSNFYADTLIMGVGGVSLQSGYTDYHVNEANTRRQMINRARKVIAVADYSKFGVTAMNFICTLSRVDVLVTDWSAPSEIVNEFRENGVTVLIADKV